MATGPIETHLHRSFNWENGAPGPQEGPRGRSANCGNGLFAQYVRLRSEINPTDSGEINVKGLDAGTYTVKETHTLAGYNTIPDFTFTIKATGLDKAEGVGENKLTVKTSTKGSNLVEVDTTNTDNGTAALIVKNKQGSGLPLTGLNGVTFTWIAGGAVLCIGVAHLIRSRKQAEESEQE